MIQNRRCYWLMSTGMVVLLLLAGCGNVSNGSGVTQNSPEKTGSTFPTATISNQISTVDFTLHGGATGTYTIRAALPTSKLRHGYREFTIDVAGAGISIYLAFFGYHGPGTYTLSEGVNGGDVRINLYGQSASWDLSLAPEAQCTVMITSDTPTTYTGIDRMRGSFSCPLLPSSSPDQPRLPVAVSDGRIDVAIIAES